MIYFHTSKRTETHTYHRLQRQCSILLINTTSMCLLFHERIRRRRSQLLFERASSRLVPRGLGVLGATPTHSVFLIRRALFFQTLSLQLQLILDVHAFLAQTLHAQHVSVFVSLIKRLREFNVLPSQVHLGHYALTNVTFLQQLNPRRENSAFQVLQVRVVRGVIHPHRQQPLRFG